MPGKNGCPLAEAVRAAYRAGEEDEAMEPRILVNGNGMPLGRIADGDYCIFYDIRGERPESGAVYTEMVEKKCARLGTGLFCTIIGRFWSLDREHNWDRIEKTYRALVEGKGLAVPADA